MAPAHVSVHSGLGPKVMVARRRSVADPEFKTTPAGARAKPLADVSTLAGKTCALRSFRNMPQPPVESGPRGFVSLITEPSLSVFCSVMLNISCGDLLGDEHKGFSWHQSAKVGERGCLVLFSSTLRLMMV